MTALRARDITLAADAAAVDPKLAELVEAVNRLPRLRLYDPAGLTPRELDILAAARDYAHLKPRGLPLTFLIEAIGFRYDNDERLSCPNPSPERQPFAAIRRAALALAARGLIDVGPEGRCRITVTPAGLDLLPPGPPKLLLDLLAKGWLVGPPPGMRDDAMRVDKEASWTMRCPGCRKAGMSYRPLHAVTVLGNLRYNAYAVCTRCGAADLV